MGLSSSISKGRSKNGKCVSVFQLYLVYIWSKCCLFPL